jgi:DNA helicase HerA-like ATPase
MNTILVGKGDGPVQLLAKYGNRHGLVAGATGTGKTVSLLVLAEGFSRLGVPVFLPDVKGDVAGAAMPGTASEAILKRAAEVGVDGWSPDANPVVFWDLYGTLGHPVRTTVSETGPRLLARMLELNDTQEGVLEIVFKLADDQGLLLLDLDDLRALLTYAAEHHADLSASYGLVSPASAAAIQRSLLALEREGGAGFFGEPALDLADLMRTDLSGRGVINILAADRLVLKPRLYSTFLLWLLSELFERLPEVGDLDAPKLVFAFDEAHLLFEDAPAALRQRIEQVVRLIRSKGVGVYFCSQYPDDVPGEILGQLGHRIQHALRAFTPRDQKAVRAAAETFVPNPPLDVARAISELGVGEALTSMLLERAVPMPVQRTRICPPRCRMGAITADERASVRARSPIGGKYDAAVNRESAYELLNARAGASAGHAHAPAAPSHADGPFRTASPDSSHADGPFRSPRPAPAEAPGRLEQVLWGTSRRQGMLEAMAKQAARTVGSQFGRQIFRGVLGGILGSSRQR